MTAESDFISLREAAQISGYSADYIGQLIRAGKIPGKQVYTNIAWLTTAEAVLAYKERKRTHKKASIKDRAVRQSRLFGLQINILKLVLRNFRSAIPLLAITFISLVLLISYLFYLVLPHKNHSNVHPLIPPEQAEPLTF